MICWAYGSRVNGDRQEIRDLALDPEYCHVE